MALSPTRVSMPGEARKGDAIEIKALVRHPMETGYRVDSVGQPIPKNIITSMIVTYNGREILNAELHQGIAANPFFSFAVRAQDSGELIFKWVDDQGAVFIERKTIKVVP